MFRNLKRVKKAIIGETKSFYALTEENLFEAERRVYMLSKMPEEEFLFENVQVG